VLSHGVLMSSAWNNFCCNMLVQTWDIDGVKSEVRRVCFNLDMLFAIQPEMIDGELHLVLAFNGAGDKSPTFIIRGEDAKRFLRVSKVEMPVDWLRPVELPPGIDSDTPQNHRLQNVTVPLM